MKKSVRVKVMMLVIIATLLLSTISVFLSYNTYKGTINDHYKRLAVDISKSAASTITMENVEFLLSKIVERYESVADSEKVSTAETGTDAYDSYVLNYQDIAESAEYKELVLELRAIQDAHSCDCVYLMIPYEKDRSYIYLSDASPEPNMPGSYDHISADQEYLFADLEYGIEPFITNYEEYGWVCTGTAPVYSSEGEIIAVAFTDISMNDVMNDCNQYLKNIFMILGAISLLLIAGCIILVEFAMVRPINKVANAARNYMNSDSNEELSEEDTHYFNKLDIHTGDEIEELSKAMVVMEDNMNTYIHDLTKITAEKERIGVELSLATQIQANYLPNIFPPFPNRKEFDLYASMTPAKEVGGDFYDFFLIDEDHICLVMADVSGKGIPAALFMMISKTLLKNHALFNNDPAAILAYVNNQLCENNDAEMFVTVWLGILTISTGEMTTASAGHEYPAIYRSETGCFELFKDKHGLPLGSFPGVKYKNEKFTLKRNDMIYVYTDGVAEATDANNELYGTDRMIAALNNNTDKMCKELCESVIEDVNQFVGEAPQFDDITMLAFKLL